MPDPLTSQHTTREQSTNSSSISVPDAALQNSPGQTDSNGCSSNNDPNGQTGFSVFRNIQPDDWEEEYERQRNRAWEGKVERDLEGWRGGHGKPRSTYPRQALPPMSYYHQPVTGQLGKHLPKEMVRIERDWSGGEVCQFETIFPLELEGRIQPAHLTSFLNSLNARLLVAYEVWPTVVDNLISVGTMWTSLWWRESHFEKSLKGLERIIQEANITMFNPAGLNVLSPREVALQYLEIEYY